MSDPLSRPPLVGDQLIEALGELLQRHPAGDEAPYLGYIDGALAGLLLSPQPVPPAEWLPRLGAGPEVQFSDPADGERFATLLRQRQTEIAAGLIEGGLAFTPIYQIDKDGKPLWQVWLAGFMSAMQLRLTAWEPLFDSDDEDLGAAFMGLLTLAATLPGLAEAVAEQELLDDVEEFTDDAPDLLPYFVETIYRRRHGLERVVMDDGFWDEDEMFEQQPILVEKVGRNDRCPCGSMKKYKKCCGAAA